MDESDKMIYLNEVDCLKFYAKDKYVVEIGAYKGYSATIMCPVAQWVTSIDTFLQDNFPEEFRGISTLNEFIKNTSKFTNHNFIVGNSHHPQVIRKTLDKIQFLFIDGDHSYKGCLRDLQNFGAKVVFDGIIGLHDYGLLYPGVIAACQNYFERRPDELHGSVAIYKLINTSNKNEMKIYPYKMDLAMVEKP